ncbi:MAG: bifunctional metallophosphatase/5'-nucleotidase [Pseudomonadota bacterium]
MTYKHATISAGHDEDADTDFSIRRNTPRQRQFIRWLLAGVLAAAVPAWAESRQYPDNPGEDGAFQTTIAAEGVERRPAGIDRTLRVKLLAINDFHGQISAGRRVASPPVGSAGVLAAYLKAAQTGLEDRTFIVHAGDHVGASPPASGLLQDEPAIMFLNQLANEHCRYLEMPIPTGARMMPMSTRRWWDPRCNVVGTLGNHEFDEGVVELERLLAGGNHANGPFLEDPWRGARFPHVAANVVDTKTGKPILPPYVIKRVDGVPIAFIGVVLETTPTVVTPGGVAGLRFLDEAEAINHYIPELRRRNVRAIVALIHQGGVQTSYDGPTRADAPAVTGDIVDTIARLHDEVDVVVSADRHRFTNAFLRNRNGKPILVTQAFSAGTAYADIDLEISRASRDVIAKSAVIVTTWADAGAGLTPDAAAAQLTADAEAKVAPLVNQVIGTAAADITRAANPAGESALGNLIADAQRAAMGTDLAFMNPGGIRDDIAAGEVTWGELYTVQPFGNNLVKMDLTGRQIHELLEQQWAGQPFPRVLQISGLSYTWDAAAPVGSRVVAVQRGGAPLDLNATYTVTVNSFLADGGDNFTVLRAGVNRVGGPVDLDALIAYIKAMPQPFNAAIEERIQRIN